MGRVANLAVMLSGHAAIWRAASCPSPTIESTRPGDVVHVSTTWCRQCSVVLRRPEQTVADRLCCRQAICLHEEDYGMLWKHWDFRTNHSEVRRSRRLVVSMIATVGNYEYGFFWYLYQDGTIAHEIKLTGILSTGEPRSMAVCLSLWLGDDLSRLMAYCDTLSSLCNCRRPVGILLACLDACTLSSA